MLAELFVYGTLMAKSAAAAMGGAERARLASGAALLGEARVRARLYDLGAYPAAGPAIDNDDVVHGELLTLADPAATLRWLDAYEGIRPGPTSNEYQRVVITATLGDGAEVSAWIYLLARDPTGLAVISSGRWTPR
jgi:gamma-glutamylcyclotransferase (GGCT)/AIG2-like uncharacterized protein YtfP